MNKTTSDIILSEKEFDKLLESREIIVKNDNVGEYYVLKRICASFSKEKVVLSNGNDAILMKFIGLD